MYTARANPAESLDGRLTGNGLAVDTRNYQAFGDNQAYRDSQTVQTAPYRLNGSERRAGFGDSYMHASAQHSPQLQPAASRGTYARGTAELNPVTAWGVITSGGGAYGSPPGHADRGGRAGRRADGALSPRRSAVADMYTTPPTAHRASISTVLSGPRSADVSRGPAYDDGRQRTHTVGTPGSRRYSQAEFDTYNERSVATTFGLESQFTRPNYDDSSMYAHTPGRDAALAAMHVMGRNPVPLSASARLRSVSGTQDILTPDTPGGAVFGARPRNHSRVSSVASPNTRARAIEDTHNALTGGGRASVVPPDAEGRHERRMHGTQTWYGQGARDTVSETLAWGTPGSGRTRTGSLAYGGTPGRQAPHEQAPMQRGNGLAIETRHRHRASYTGSALGSHTPSAVGSSQHRSARLANGNSSFVGASGRRPRHQSLQAKNGRTPIRSNRFHREEALCQADIEGQEFVSSDEENFENEESAYGGDMVSQQKLIQKQQRHIYDLNLQCKMMKDAMQAKTDKPVDELLANYGRTCASNRRANRQIELLENEVKALKKAEEQHAAALEEANKRLEAEANNARYCKNDLDEAKAKITELEAELADERLESDHWHRKSEVSPAGSRSPRARAGTTTASETTTLRAPSPRGDKRLLEAEKQRQQQQQLEEDLRQSRRKVRGLEEQLRGVQLSMKRSQDSRLALDKPAQAEVSRLTRENEALQDQCSALQRQLSEVHAQRQMHVEATLAAATSAMSLSDDYGAEGSAAQRAEIAKLQLENRDLGARVQLAESRAQQVAEQLRASEEKQRALCHDYLRPCLRELTVGPAQAENVYDHVRRWSQLKVVVPQTHDATPTKSSSRRRSNGIAKPMG